jgi:hypothetical protein
MDTAVARVHDFLNPSDDQRATCECGKELRWCGHAKKWFHVHNFMTYCNGRAIDENHNDEPKGRPVSDCVHTTNVL